jgi:hypothetical protein
MKKATVSMVYNWLRWSGIRKHDTLECFHLKDVADDILFPWNAENRKTTYDTLLLLSVAYEVAAKHKQSCSVKTMAQALRLTLRDDCAVERIIDNLVGNKYD